MIEMTPEQILDKLKPMEEVEVWEFDNEEGFLYGTAVYNTTKHQLASLDAFAWQIGFSRSEGDLYFWSTRNTKYTRLSLETMVAWHNTSFLSAGTTSRWHSIERELPNISSKLVFDIEDMIKAIKAKLFKKVYLQVKKNKSRLGNNPELIVQKHILEFC